MMERIETVRNRKRGKAEVDFLPPIDFLFRPNRLNREEKKLEMQNLQCAQCLSPSSSNQEAPGIGCQVKDTATAGDTSVNY